MKSKTNVKVNVEPDYGIQNLLGEDENMESELIGGKSIKELEYPQKVKLYPTPGILPTTLYYILISGLLSNLHFFLMSNLHLFLSNLHLFCVAQKVVKSAPFFVKSAPFFSLMFKGFFVVKSP